MIWNWWLQVGEWNPQLWREVKGRFKRRNVVSVAALSIVGQILLLFYFHEQEIPKFPDDRDVSILDLLIPDLDDGLLFDSPSWLWWSENYQRWWFEVFHSLTWIGVLLLVTLGSYLLIKDLGREARRGTLLLVRLSPQMAQNILLGKLLGVPSLLYLAIALAIPLHLWSAFEAGVPMLTLFSIYTLVALVCSLAYIFTLLYVLGWGASAAVWYVVISISLIGYLPLHGVWIWWGDVFRRSLRSNPPSFEAPDNGRIAVLIIGMVIAATTYYLWRSCVLRFQHPSLYGVSSSIKRVD